MTTRLKFRGSQPLAEGLCHSFSPLASKWVSLDSATRWTAEVQWGGRIIFVVGRARRSEAGQTTQNDGLPHGAPGAQAESRGYPLACKFERERCGTSTNALCKRSRVSHNEFGCCGFKRRTEALREADIIPPNDGRLGHFFAAGTTVARSIGALPSRIFASFAAAFALASSET